MSLFRVSDYRTIGHNCTDFVEGTGKSFIGALLAKAIVKHTRKTILVVCYTNHALDDILTSLINIGIPTQDMLRLGGKSTPITEPLRIQKQDRPEGRRTRDQWTIIDKHKDAAELSFQRMSEAFKKTLERIDYKDIMSYLEFEYPDYFAAFTVPESDDGMAVVDKHGRTLRTFFLINQWSNGWNAGPLQYWTTEDPSIERIWKMNKTQRTEMRMQWAKAIYQDIVANFASEAAEYNKILDKVAAASSNTELFRSKRIVGCTTTAAAKYSDEIQAFNPDVLLVEEAGEILESHVLTALGPEASQLILIGDHK